MSARVKRIARRVLRDESGQTLIMMAVLMIGFFGMAAIVADVGDVYYSYSELRSSTDAAALAAAQGMPFNTSTVDQAALNATEYSAQTGKLNAWGNLDVTNYTYQSACLSTGVGAEIPCLATGHGTTANVIQVTQTAKVRTYFAALFGHRYITLTATATAMIAGAGNAPYNIALVLDTTGSMNDQDSACGTTQLACAISGMQTFLSGLSPCAASGCDGNGGTNSGTNTSTATDGLDRVALFTFPNLNTSEAGYSYGCSGSYQAADELQQTGENPPYGWQYNVPYVFPTIGAAPGTTTYVYTTTTGWGWNQQTTTHTVNVTSEVTYGLGDANGFMTNYSTPGTNGLSTTSDLVVALGGKSGCNSIQAPYVDGTYYASTIYEAQSALTAEAAANPGTQNVMIILGDGDMNVSQYYVQQFQSAVTSASQTNGLVPTNNPSAANGYYPSLTNDCGQAIWAANYAKQHGTEIFTVAYGALTGGANTYDNGCSTDTTGVPLPAGTSSGGNSQNISPCQTMKDMASNLSDFYSDQSGGDGCTSQNAVGSLAGIFYNIRARLTHVRLIPNSAWPGA